MNYKEIALKTIKFQNPEEIISFIPGYWVGYPGANHEGWEGGGHDCPVGTRWTDIWGTGWHKEHPDVMAFPEINPLAEIEALDDYIWPDPNDERIKGWIYGGAKGFGEAEKQGAFLTGTHRDTLWEKAYMLVGMENMMIYFYTDPDYARTILRNIMDFQMGIARHYIDVGVEMVFCSDDLGTQRSLLMSEEIINEFLLPEYRRLFSFYRQHGVLIHFHSCGHIEPLLDTFIDLGIDILNPMQATANNIENVIKKTYGKMAINGAISTAVLSDGPIDAIKEHVAHTIEVLGKNGGYFCSPDQHMPLPDENVAAMHEALAEHRGYSHKKL